MLARRHALERLRRKKLARTESDEIIERRSARRAPLSLAQERLWFLDRLEPDGARFNLLSAIRFKGPLEVPALEASLNEMIRRHEILRTTFEAVNGTPEQAIASRLVLEVPRIDLTCLRPEQRGGLLASLYTRETQRPFDLERGPLARWPVLVLGRQEHVLLLVMHQIISDRWSRGILVEELATLYLDALERRPFSLPEPNLQFADFAFWQRRFVTAERLRPQLEHWRRVLHDPPRVELPTDRPRPAVASYRGAMIYKVIEPRLLESLKRFARDHELTLFMALVAAVMALVLRYTGQQDLVLGTPLAQRRHPQIGRLIGFFINMLALRCRVEPASSYATLCAAVRGVALSAFSHDEVPFEQVVETVVEGRDMSRHPLFQIAVVLQNTPLPSLGLPGLEIGLAEVDWGTTAYDLSFFFWETALWEHLEPGLSLTVTYGTDLYDATTVHRHCAHLRALLEAALESPKTPLEDLEILGHAERHQVLLEWGTCASADPGEAGLGELFARVADLHESRLAVRDGDRALSYGELTRAAGAMARHLLERGVTEDTVVGVALRGLEQVVATLAVILAGGAYAPVDPSWPRPRQEEALSRAGACFVIAPEDGSFELPGLERLDLVLEGDGPVPSSRSHPESLAYVLTTSGSSGRPKSVGIGRLAVASLVLGGPALRPGERMGQFSSPAFDASTYEIWATLTSGACLVVIDPRTVLDAEIFAERLRHEHLDAALLSTPLFHHLARRRPAVFAPLRCLVFGGEEARPELVAAVRTAAPRLELWHAYGPTEATTFATLHRVTADMSGELPVPIGGPFAGRRAHVLDRHARPVPPGVVGEIWLGGGLARGYLGAPRDTALAFVPDPWSERRGERLYRTGDQGRHRANGELVFAGRFDDQLEVRGHRVEPREIEAVLEEDRAVEEAVVTLAPGGALAAHAVLLDGTRDDTARAVAHRLRALLRRRLPETMVPGAFAFARTLPRTPTGKVDRQALASPNADFRWVSERYQAPRDPEEEALVEIFRRVLPAAREIGVYDDFFTLGGHSLSAVEALESLNRRFDEQLTLMAFFEQPTVAGLAAKLAGGARERTKP